MPNCDFYAASGDFEPILQFVFDNLGCRVLEAYSEFDSELREFSCVDELVKHYNRALKAHVMLWPVEASNQVRIRRIELSQKASKLGSYRYTVEGWGLIQLLLGGLTGDGLRLSHTNHNTRKRADKWSNIYSDNMGSPSTWDWDLVTRTSGKLNRRIRSLAITKIGSRSVLPSAKALLDSGVRALEI